MKLLFKNKILPEQADELIEKYYEGQTTCAEEEILRNFLKRKNLPAKYETEKAIFSHFESKTQTQSKTFVLKPFYRGAAAAVILILIGFSVYKISPGKSNFAYVDGKKITHIESIKSLANTSLSDISNDENAIENQLSEFENINF